jgi:hypothetical protein
LLSQIKNDIPNLNFSTFPALAAAFCGKKTSKAKYLQAKAVLVTIGTLLGIRKDTIRDGVKTKINPDTSA